MRIVRLVLAALLLVAPGVCLGATQAAAGGPTSVLLTSPGTGAAAALHVSGSRDYLTLDEQLHDTTPVPEGDTPSGTDLTATWLIHDVMIWRVDRIRVGADGTVAVSTTTSTGEGTPDTSVEAPWMLVRDPAAVMRVLDGLGLMGAGGGDAGASDAVAETAAEPEAVEAPSLAGTSTEAGSSRWWTLSGGVVLGLVLGVALSLMAVGATRRPLKRASAR